MIFDIFSFFFSSFPLGCTVAVMGRGPSKRYNLWIVSSVFGVICRVILYEVVVTMIKMSHLSLMRHWHDLMLQMHGYSHMVHKTSPNI